MTSRRALLGIAASFALAAAAFCAESGDPVSSTVARSESPFLQEMQERIAGVKVSIIQDAGSREVARIDHPVFRYSDEEREIFDATLWLWTDDGRPIALQKDEAAASDGVPKWTVCFASFAAQNLDVRWPRGGQEFTTKAAGCDFVTIPDPPKPADNDRIVRSQIKQIAKRFSAACSYEGRGRSVARLLTKPIHEYESRKHGVVAGAIFGFASYGTNPDGYILIELRKTPSGQEWVYGCARMTIYAVEVLLDDKPVWDCEAVRPTPQYFDRWTFFVEPRTPGASSP